ncbi:MAG: aminotransferase class III-fold pyridoxal phosphate-dependent enzyme, partial [Candidatus Sericytochromatia bacterium]|nr:aminotransferase class III-fold pyridoxal phosphate-dependent enzyme [Candidatus Sericytochromatia bacterium]
AALLRAVRHCWSSMWSDRVAVYLARKGIGHEHLGMGVVVQRLVDAEVSGVLFTVDPTTGIEEHLRAEACFGLGEALVSGRVTPDRFLIHRQTGKSLETVIANKEIRMVRLVDGGVAETALSEAEGSKPTLSDDHLSELARIGRQVQAYYGCPQDIEWVLAAGTIALVQSRPITTIAYNGIAGEWTTADFKDGGVSARVCSPYMWSLYDYIWQQSMPGYFRDIKLLRHHEPIRWGRVFYGRPYWNLGEVKRCLHRVPGFNERNFDRDLGIEGIYEGDGTVIPVNALTIAKAIPVLIALTGDYKRRIKTNQAFLAEFDTLARHYESDPATLDKGGLYARYKRLVETDYFRTESTYFYTIYNTSNAKLDFKVELDKANKQIDEPLSYLKLLSGLQNMRHLDPMRDLWVIANTVRADVALRATVDRTHADALADALATEHAEFWSDMLAFLDKYSHHSVAELDITQPRWNEDVTFVMQTLKAYVTSYDPDRDPVVMSQRQHDVYQAEYRRAEVYFSQRGIWGIPAAKGFFGKLELLRTYSWWREELRDRSSRMYAMIRRDTRAVATLFVQAELLQQPEDIWYLTWRDIIAVMDGALSGAGAQAMVTSRREDGDGYRHFTNPNELGRRFAVGRSMGPTVTTEGALVGTPCSPGLVKARVRLIPTIQDGDRLRAGEILVTQFTDPGWTPLFNSIAGVITEAGGILSHAAVIAREYGIPAVLAVPGVTGVLRDGQWVLLDGHSGTIMPLDDEVGDDPTPTLPTDGTAATRPAAVINPVVSSVVDPAPIAAVEPPPTDAVTPPAIEGVAPSVAPFPPIEPLTPAPDPAGQPRPGAYHDFARPELGRVMKALGLDITYLWAKGDAMAHEVDGKRHQVIDLLGGYGASLFGHHHPDLVAVARSVFDERLPIQAQASTRAWAGELAQQLSERVGAVTGRSYVVTLTNSGAEAIEAAMKHAELERFEAASELTRRWRRRSRVLIGDAVHEQTGFLREVSRELDLPTGMTLAEACEAIGIANERARWTRPVFLALERAFHGKTSGASQVTYNPDYREPFSRIGVHCEFLPPNDPHAWDRAIVRATVRTWDVRSDQGRLVLIEKPWVNVSAILIEPIQGEGGIHPLEPADATRIRTLADTHSIPVIIDEIQSGMGRTGAFLASTACGIRGDYYTLAKSLGGGIAKIGAVMIDQARYRPSFGLKQTSTFAEDDLSCRIAIAALALHDRENVPARCQRLGDHLIGRLQALVARFPGILHDVRGRGLMIGLEFCPQDHNPSNVIRMLSDQGFLGYAIAGYMVHEEGFRVAPTLSAATTIRLEPSAFIDPAHLDRFCDAMARLCTILERGNAYRFTRYIVGLAHPGDTADVADFRERARKTRREEPRCEKRVAFVSHLISAKDAVHWDPSLAQLAKGAVEHYQLAAHRILGPSVYDQVHVTSTLGETVHLSVYGLNLTSKSIVAAMRARDTDWIVKLIEEAVSRARDNGCQVVGLGGYASIVTDNGKRLSERGLSITTGNSLTVGMGLESLRRAAKERGIALETATLGVVGATGNIGSVYARMMAADVHGLVLVGRGVSARLEQVAWQIYEDALTQIEAGGFVRGVAAAIVGTSAVQTALAQGPDGRGDQAGEALGRALMAEMGEAVPIRISEEADALRTCQLIVAATSSPTPVIYPSHLGDHPTIICDISVPEDVAPEMATERPDVCVIKGGLVAMPHDPEFRIGGVPLPDGLAFACMAETLLLGLMGVRDNFSYGPVEPDKVRQVMAWAAINGFNLGDDKTQASY